MGRRATIKDVAFQAGVSKSTVSLVLQGSELIKPETAEKVRKAIDELGYVYNRAAASLRSHATGLVGIVVNDLRNPFFTEFAIAAQTALSKQGYMTVVANTDEDPELQTKLIRSMQEHDVSALLVCPAHNSSPDIFRELQDRNFPVVQVIRQVAETSNSMPHLGFDYVAGGRDACQHLVNQGCKQVAFIGGFEHALVTGQRCQGYREIAAETGMREDVFYGRPTRAFGEQMADKLLAEYPDIDGYFCFNDMVAMGVMRRLVEQDISIGKDKRVIGFDNIEGAEFAWPPLSSVRCDIDDIAERSAGFLSEWLKTGQQPDVPSLWETSLIIRESTIGANHGG